jgi:adenylosuccinate synthase
MPTKLVLGLQHGDEGKGRVVDDLVQNWADVVVRFQGGGNAGHTVYDRKGNKFVTHILPVGVLSKEIINIIARGCVVDIEEFCQEVADLNVQAGSNLSVSGFCPIIEPTHKIIDRLKYQKRLGTTAKGIGPAYSDFYARDSILIKDIVNSPAESLIKIQTKFFNLQEKRAQDGESLEDLKPDFDLFNRWVSNYRKMSETVGLYRLNNENVLQDYYKKDYNILLEGAQGSGLNIYSDNYPDVTSSSPSIGGALNSTGLNHKQIDEVIGVIKSYKTKVGSGSFPSIITDGQEKILAQVGQEFGATTGRPRQCGWLDLDEVKLAVRQNGVDHLCIVKTDVMTHIENPHFFIHGRNYSLTKINTVSAFDPGFAELLKQIEMQTGIKNLSYTTGPKRGEIVWYSNDYQDKNLKE